jgi:ABC-2 type transport system permease protein
MRNELSFALYSIKKNFQNSAELRTSFLMNIVGMALNNVAFIVIWACFVKAVGIVNGWTVADIYGLMGFSALSFGVFHTLLGGIHLIPDAVAKGSFDRFMLSPKNLIVRIATSAMSVSAIGDFVFGVICLWLYLAMIHGGLLQLVFVISGAIIATVVMSTFWLFISSLSFLFSDPKVVVDGIESFFMAPTLFHGGAFQGWLRVFFTFIIPSLLVGALPVEAVKSVSLWQLGLLLLLALFWFLISIWAFYKGVRRYESANLTTFGS